MAVATTTTAQDRKVREQRVSKVPNAVHGFTTGTGRCTFSTDYHGSTDHGRLRLLLLLRLLRAAAAGCCETLRRFDDGDGVRRWRWRWRWRSGFAFSRLCTSRRIPNDYLATDAADALETRRAMPLQASANARQATHNEQTDDGRQTTLSESESESETESEQPRKLPNESESESECSRSLSCSRAFTLSFSPA